MMGAPDCSAYARGTAQAYNAPMFGSRFVHRSMHSVWRTLMCLALFAFMLRAMVPAGFMPDPGALQNGRFGVAFCSADSATAHLALEFGRHGQSGPHHHEGPMGCPFAMLATQALGTSRSEEHTSELQSLMRISYAVFCLKKTKQKHMS